MLHPTQRKHWLGALPATRHMPRFLLASLLASASLVSCASAQVATSEEREPTQADPSYAYPAEYFYTCKPIRSGSCEAQRPALFKYYFGTVEGERSLCEAPNADAEAYRLAWVRTFDNPILAHAERRGTSYSLRGLRYSGAGGYDRGVVEEDSSGALTREAWQQLVAVVDSASFWSLPRSRLPRSNSLDRTGRSGWWRAPAESGRPSRSVGGRRANRQAASA